MAIDFDDIDLDTPAAEVLDGEAPTNENEDLSKSSAELVKTAEKQVDLSAELAKLQEERNALLKRLNTLSVTSAAQQKRLESLAKAVEEKEKKLDQGPTLEQIDQSFMARIQELENAIEEAEIKDPTQVAKLSRELRAVERQYNAFQIEARAELLRPPPPEDLVGRSVAETKAALEFESLREQILEDFPELNAASPDANEAAIREVYEIYQPLIRGGEDPAKALKKSVKVVVNEYGLVPVSKRTASPSKEAHATKAASDRKTDAVKRNVEAAKNVPPDLTTAGMSDTGKSIVDKFDFEKMSIDEFMRIPDADLAKIEEALRRYGE